MADVFYTSELFRNLVSAERRECSKMMSNAVDHLWERTAAQGYKTPPELVSFAERHRRLLKCVEHLFQENREKRRISNLRITPGLAAALCYIMGASGSKTDGDEYRSAVPPSEKGINWDRYQQARDFWALIGSHESFEVVRRALAQLMKSGLDTDNIGLGGRLPERLAIVQKAWDVYVAYDEGLGVPMFSEADLTDGGALVLSYNDLDDTGAKLPDGQIRLIDLADFGGIDLPEEDKGETTGEAPPHTTAEIQTEKDRIERERAEALAKQRQQQTTQPAAKAISAIEKLKGMHKS